MQASTNSPRSDSSWASCRQAAGRLRGNTAGSFKRLRKLQETTHQEQLQLRSQCRKRRPIRPESLADARQETLCVPALQRSLKLRLRIQHESSTVDETRPPHSQGEVQDAPLPLCAQQLTGRRGRASFSAIHAMRDKVQGKQNRASVNAPCIMIGFRAKARHSKHSGGYSEGPANT